MAMGSAGGAGRTRRGRRRGRRGALSEINVTPMVDVMLVLLIIFMISAPLLTSGIKIQLPKTEAAALKDEGDPITVSIQKDGSLYVGDDAATFEQLSPRLLAITDNDTSKPIYVRAEGAAPYEVVAKVMARLSTSGFVKINLLTENVGKADSKSEVAP
ncbi:biopolymer transporter ExbD [Asticcacaulis sp. BYS171W]|uniref:Biopolymer transporter ExbD n=1 Tax=Asticcacaulis aquaticus TaxID=2984212 RepID=A0ABT5HVK0_9CAUL|nr:biopolymer transporter ExbD [Asticcacaulis aquaticus]MDC7684079.1 biopolymer transporter ExbD [Asticcacaulis aquaticus]